MSKIQFGSEVYTWLMQKPSKRETRPSNHAAMQFLPSVFSCGWLLLCAISTEVSLISHVGLSASFTQKKWQHLMDHIQYTELRFNGAESWGLSAHSNPDQHEIILKVKECGYRGWLTIECQDAPLLSSRSNPYYGRTTRHNNSGSIV